MSASGVVARATVPVYAALGGAGLLLGGADVGAVLVGAAFGAVGAVLVARVPRHPIGWLFVAMALWGVAVELAAGYARQGLLDDPGSLPGASAAAWVTGWGLTINLGLFAVLLFPTGRLLSPRWRLVLWGAAAWLALLVAGYALKPGPLWTIPAVDNPLGVESLAPALVHVDSFEVAGSALFMLAVVVSLVLRFRRSHGVEREQLKWLTFVVCLLGVLVAASTVGIAAGVEQTAGFEAAITVVFLLILAGIPGAIGIAILRHRLWDIDVVIRRTLVYGGLTATLGATYLASVLLVSLAVGESDLAVAASTLGVAALFGPARARIQAAVDRRFYRRRYDAARTVEAFAARLREELDLDELGADLSAVARRTVQPAHVSLWLRSGR
jgi:hypothetical protein